MFDFSLLIYVAFFFLPCINLSPSSLSHSFENTKVWCKWIGLPEDKKFDTDCRNFPIKLYIRWRVVKRNSCLKHLISHYPGREFLSETITVNRLKYIAQPSTNNTLSTLFPWIIEIVSHRVHIIRIHLITMKINSEKKTHSEYLIFYIFTVCYILEVRFDEL